MRYLAHNLRQYKHCLMMPVIYQVHRAFQFLLSPEMKPSTFRLAMQTVRKACLQAKIPYTNWLRSVRLLPAWEFYAYDETSDLKLLETYTLYSLSSYSDFAKLNDDIINKTFVISDATFNSPCAYMYKKITNDKIYDVFNQILDESYYKAIGNTNQSSFYFPVMDAEPIRQLIKADENWEYTGFSGESEKDVKLLNTMNDIFEMMVKNKETANYIAEYYFSNEEFNYKISAEINYLLSKLIIGNLDYNEKEVDDMINKEIDDFVINFNIHYN